MNYSLSSYLLVIPPKEALQQKIQAAKQLFAESYDATINTKGLANITLIRFYQYEMIEHRLLPRLLQLFETQGSFMVDINGFDSQPTHSIYMNITTKAALINLVKSMRGLQFMLTANKEHKAHFITDPAIPFARKLLPWQYEKGWLEMSNTSFSGSFLVDTVLLLRKREGESGFTKVKNFSLLNRQKIITVQGNLFM